MTRIHAFLAFLGLLPEPALVHVRIGVIDIGFSDFAPSSRSRSFTINS